MGISAKLNLRQSQSLVITPQLMQAIRLLQMSALDLERFVATEIEQNPLLRQEDGAGDPSDLPSADNDANSAEADPVADATDADRSSLYPEEAASDVASARTDHSPLRSSGSSSTPASDGGWQADVAAAESFAACLERQADMTFALPGERMIAQVLLENLDPSGYLIGGLEPIAERLGIAPPEVEAVLQRCQGFEPSGLFARDLSE